METKKLIFGDPESIAYRDREIEKMEKKQATLVEVIEHEIEVEPEYEYSYKCPHCGQMEDGVPDREVAYDKLVICCGCRKWLKLKI